MKRWQLEASMAVSVSVLLGIGVGRVLFGGDPETLPARISTAPILSFVGAFAGLLVVGVRNRRA